MSSIAVVITRETGCTCHLVYHPHDQGLRFLHVTPFSALPCPHGSRVRPFDAADAVEMLGLGDVDLDSIAAHEAGWAHFPDLKQEAEHNASRLRDAASYVRDALRVRSGEEEGPT
jgi:hypothetical protein